MKMVILQMFLFIEIKFKLLFVQSDCEGEGQCEGRNDGTQKGRNKVKWSSSIREDTHKKKCFFQWSDH